MSNETEKKQEENGYKNATLFLAGVVVGIFTAMALCRNGRY